MTLNEFEDAIFRRKTDFRRWENWKNLTLYALFMFRRSLDLLKFVRKTCLIKLEMLCLISSEEMLLSNKKKNSDGWYLDVQKDHKNLLDMGLGLAAVNKICKCIFKNHIKVSCYYI